MRTIANRDRGRASARSSSRRAAEYNTITPALRDELAAAIDEADADRDGARDPAARRGPGVLRRLRARLVDARAGEPSERRASGVWDSVADCRMMRPLRRHLHEALVRVEADDRRGAGLVHRRRHRHGAVRRHHRRRRGRVVRLPAVARVGHADHRDVGLPDGPRAGEALPAHRRRDPRARGGRASASSSRPCPTTSCRSTRCALAAAHGAACRRTSS